MADNERTGVVSYLAENPDASIALGGGLCKVRVPRAVGGYRIAYVFGGVHMPLFLVTVFAKNEKANLSKAEQAEVVALSKLIIDNYGKKK